MRHFLSILLGVLVFSYSHSQSLSLQNVSQNTLCATGKDTLVYRLTAANIPPSTNVVIYQSTDSTFNPYLGQGDSIGFVPGQAIKRDSIAFQPCLQMLGIFIDACGPAGQEGRNEYIMLTSGTSGFLVNDIGIDYSSQNNTGGGENDDVNIGASACGYKTPDAALMANLRQGSCNPSNVIAVGPGGSVPPNVFVVIFTSDSVNAPYSLNGLCNTGYPVYVMQSSCIRSIGAFTNAPRCDAQRYRKTTITDFGNQCADDFTYDLCGIYNLDGTYAIRQPGRDTASVANNGIRRNTVDSCGGIDYSQLAFSSDTILRYPLNNPSIQCNQTYYLKAVTNPPATQPLSNPIPFRLVCLNLSVLVQNNPICTGDQVQITNSSTDPNASFSWVVFPGAGISGAVNGSGSSISQTLTNSGSNRDSVIYRITAKDGSCNVIQDVKIYVDPAPAPFSLGNDTSVCGNFSKTLSTGNPLTIWSTGVTAPLIVVNTVGTYWAKVPVSCGDVSDTIVISLNGIQNPINLGPDTSVCGGFSKTLSTGDATTVWSTGATGASIIVNTPGVYWARITNGCGTTSDTVRIAQAPPVDAGISGITAICPGNTTTLTVTGGPFDSVRWNTNATSNAIVVGAAGNYFVTVYRAGCSGIAAVNVTVGALVVNISGSLAICSGQSTTLDAGTGFDTYSWNTGANTQTISASSPGQYIVNVTQGACSASDTVVVSGAAAPTLSISGDSVICSGTVGTLDAGPGFASYSWSTGATTQSIPITQGGTYSVTVSNGGCSGGDSIVVFQRPQITFDLQVDNLSCLALGKITVLNVQNGAAPYTYQLNNDPAQAIDSFPGLNGGTYLVTVTDTNNCKAYETVLLDAPLPIELDLGPDVTIELGQVYNIPGTISGAQSPLTFSWSPTDSLSCLNCVDPIAGPDSTTKYVLLVTDSRGCLAADSLVINVFERIDIYLPDIFTPNGDQPEKNNVFYPLGNAAKVQVEYFAIFNRWGEKVYENSDFPPSDPVYGWDGTYKGNFALIDSYVYYVTAVTRNGEKKEYKGTVVLLR